MWVSIGLQVDPAVGDQVEVVRDRVLALPSNLLDTEGVGADPGDLLEVQRAPLPPARRVHAGLHERARGLRTRTPTSNVSGLPTVSYTTSIAPG